MREGSASITFRQRPAVPRSSVATDTNELPRSERTVAAMGDTAADDGLFGPRSVTWRIHVEPVLFVGGMRALLLQQSLHPRVMPATYQNSALFDPEKAFPRFLRTVEFAQTRTFGSTAEVERVRRLHAKLQGYDPDTGERYRVDEPSGLLWVHCAEIDSNADVAQRAGILDGAGVDAYIAENVRAAQTVGLNPADVPASRAELAAYFARVRPQLRITDEARRWRCWFPNPRLRPGFRTRVDRDYEKIRIDMQQRRTGRHCRQIMIELRCCPARRCRASTAAPPRPVPPGRVRTRRPTPRPSQERRCRARRPAARPAAPTPSCAVPSSAAAVPAAGV